MRKRCLICREAKPLDAFHLDARNADGRRPECGPCRNTRNRQLDGGAQRYRPWQVANAAKYLPEDGR